MKKFQIGDKVKHRDEAISGKIIELFQNHAIVETEDGFDEKISFYHLVLANEMQINISNTEEKHIDSYLEIRSEKVHEIDLHIENLNFNWKNIPKEKILERQLAAFHEEMRIAIRDKVDKLIVIHGKGKGILKDAILREIIRYTYQSISESQLPKLKNAALEVNFKSE